MGKVASSSQGHRVTGNHSHSHTHTHEELRVACFWTGRKPENPDKTHTNTGRPCKLHTGRSLGPGVQPTTCPTGLQNIKEKNPEEQRLTMSNSSSWLAVGAFLLCFFRFSFSVWSVRPGGGKDVNGSAAAANRLGRDSLCVVALELQCYTVTLV